MARADNQKDDKLAKMTSVLVNWELEESTVQEQLIAHIHQALQPIVPIDWQTPIITFLQHGTLLEEPGQARILKRRASRFTPWMYYISEPSLTLFSNVSVLMKLIMSYVKSIKAVVKVILVDESLLGRYCQSNTFGPPCKLTWLN